MASQSYDVRAIPTPIEGIPVENRKAIYNAVADAIAVYLSSLPAGIDVESAADVFCEWVKLVFKMEARDG